MALSLGSCPAVTTSTSRPKRSRARTTTGSLHDHGGKTYSPSALWTSWSGLCSFLIFVDDVSLDLLMRTSRSNISTGFSLSSDLIHAVVLHDFVFHAFRKCESLSFYGFGNRQCNFSEFFLLVYLNQDKVGALQLVLSGADMVSMSGTDSSRQVFRQRALALLQQTIEDAFRGKRQFLSGNDLMLPSGNLYSILYYFISTPILF